MTFQGLARYGLDKNPYKYERELNPLSSAADEELLIRVDGFRGLDTVDDYLKQAVEEQRAAFFMVTGRNGTGRSSFANYILARYCHHRAIAPDKLIVPPRVYDGHDKVFIIKKWMGYLRARINQKRLELPDALWQKFQSYLTETKEETLEPDFQDVTGRISAELGRPEVGYGFACCLEDVQDFKIIAAAMEIFETVETVCIFTARDYYNVQNDIIAPFNAKAERMGGVTYELNLLSGFDVRKIVETRWKETSACGMKEKCVCRNPFDLDGIVEAFNDKPRTIARSLLLVAELLEDRVRNLPAGACWPDDPNLGFSSSHLKLSVPDLDKKLK